MNGQSLQVLWWIIAANFFVNNCKICQRNSNYIIVISKCKTFKAMTKKLQLACTKIIWLIKKKKNGKLRLENWSPQQLPEGLELKAQNSS